MMRTSPAGIALIKRYEGLELEAYQDIADVWTIGYGHTGPDAKPGAVWTEQIAEAALTRDLELREDAVTRLVSVPLNQHEFDALVSFVYNVGVAAFKTSTALKRLNRGDRTGAADALTWWNKANVDGVLRPVEGLTRRRAAERELFLRPVAPALHSGEETEIDDGCVIAPGKCAEISITAPEHVRPDKKGLWEWLCGKP